MTNNDIFERVADLTAAPVFEAASEPERAVSNGWRVWMGAAAVHATVAIATTGTLLAAPAPSHACAAEAPGQATVKFAYHVHVPLLTAAQKARAERRARVYVTRPHPRDPLEEADFV